MDIITEACKVVKDSKMFVKPEKFLEILTLLIVVAILLLFIQIYIFWTLRNSSI
jgi:hypothetical protein